MVVVLFAAHVVVPESCVVDLEGTADGVRGVVMAAMRKAALDAIEHQVRGGGRAEQLASRATLGQPARFVEVDGVAVKVVSRIPARQFPVPLGQTLWLG